VVGGAAAGASLERGIEPDLPKDEMEFYRDLLRRGRTLVFVVAEDDVHADVAREALRQSGAWKIDAARDEWHIGLRNEAHGN
jgi:hypothetical protein